MTSEVTVEVVTNVVTYASIAYCFQLYLNLLVGFTIVRTFICQWL